MLRCQSRPNVAVKTIVSTAQMRELGGWGTNRGRWECPAPLSKLPFVPHHCQNSAALSGHRTMAAAMDRSQLPALHHRNQE